MRCNGSNWAVYSPGSWDGFRNDVWALWAGVIMRLEHHLVGGYVRYISPHIIIIISCWYVSRAWTWMYISTQSFSSSLGWVFSCIWWTAFLMLTLLLMSMIICVYWSLVLSLGWIIKTKLSWWAALLMLTASLYGWCVCCSTLYGWHVCCSTLYGWCVCCSTLYGWCVCCSNLYGWILWWPCLILR